jgi:hypothetical protein
LKKGEATKEDIDELQGFVLEGVDLYENEPTELHPLYWNHSSGRWDDHPQSVEKEMARVHEESLRIEAVVPSVWNLWGLIGPSNSTSPSSQTQTQSRPNVRTNLRVHGGYRPGAPSANDTAGNSATSSSSASHSHHLSWNSAVVGPALSFLGAFFLSFTYRSMKYYEPKTTGVLQKSLRVAIFVMEKILPPVG